MKKHFLPFLAVLSLVVLSVSCAQKNKEADAEKNRVALTSDGEYSGVVYFNMDSLVNNYDMFKDLSATFKDKASKVDSELEQKGRAFESRVKSSQEKLEKGLLTRSEAEKLQQTLGNEQQSVLAYREKMLGEMQEEQNVMQNKILDAIQTYIKAYNEKKKYALILNTNELTHVVMGGDPALDITQELIEGLNKEYVPEKK